MGTTRGKARLQVSDEDPISVAEGVRREQQQRQQLRDGSVCEHVPRGSRPLRFDVDDPQSGLQPLPPLPILDGLQPAKCCSRTGRSHDGRHDRDERAAGTAGHAGAAAAARAADGGCPAAAAAATTATAEAAAAEHTAADESTPATEAHVRRSGSQLGGEAGLAKAISSIHHQTQIM